MRISPLSGLESGSRQVSDSLLSLAHRGGCIQAMRYSNWMIICDYNWNSDDMKVKSGVPEVVFTPCLLLVAFVKGQWLLTLPSFHLSGAHPLSSLLQLSQF